MYLRSALHGNLSLAAGLNADTSTRRCKSVHGSSAKKSLFWKLAAASTPVDLQDIHLFDLAFLIVDSDSRARFPRNAGGRKFSALVILPMKLGYIFRFNFWLSGYWRVCLKLVPSWSFIACPARVTHSYFDKGLPCLTASSTNMSSYASVECC